MASGGPGASEEGAVEVFAMFPAQVSARLSVLDRQ